MRWLLLKDLRLLRRSPLLVALLILYPVVLASLLGAALNSGPQRPTVAIYDQIPKTGSTAVIGDRIVNVHDEAAKLFSSVDAIPVKSRQEAIDMVKSGKALAAVIVPPDIVQKLTSETEQATIEVLVNANDPIKKQFVEDTIRSQIATGNSAMSRLLVAEANHFLHLLLQGGTFEFLGQSMPILGLARSEQYVAEAAKKFPPGSKERKNLDAVMDFAKEARVNLNLAGTSAVAKVGEPLRATVSSVTGASPPVSSFAASVAVSFSLMFVAVLLAAGLFAAEREENALARLVRGPISRSGVVAGKVSLATSASALLMVILLAVMGAFVTLEWQRFGYWLAAVVVSSAGFSAMGVAVGAVMKDVRAASLFTVMAAFPIAMLGLLQSDTVGPGFFDVARGISALFPFRPTMTLMSQALYDTGGDMWLPVVHLVILAAAYGAIARLAMRRIT